MEPLCQLCRACFTVPTELQGLETRCGPTLSKAVLKAVASQWQWPLISGSGSGRSSWSAWRLGALLTSNLDLASAARYDACCPRVADKMPATDTPAADRCTQDAQQRLSTLLELTKNTLHHVACV
jgi:hypothetical protein